ncbi:hypothetical protein HAX54_002328 [Datura stramonium]|uniref:Uncharacterized protein n=1 Tax=Datura stramonium TaxID=4076 RepID=A0ABS8T512_DATST|nr:hypothetical protein [Datura stramonium]
MWLDLVYARLIPSHNTTQVAIEFGILVAYIMDHTHINVGEIIADQFKRKAKQQATSLPYPSLMIEVLQSDVIYLRKDMDTLTGPLPSSHSNPPRPAIVISQPEASKSSLDDWWVGCDCSSKIVSDEEISHSRPPPPPMLTVKEVDLSWKPGGVDNTSHHELLTPSV